MIINGIKYDEYHTTYPTGEKSGKQWVRVYGEKLYICTYLNIGVVPDETLPHPKGYGENPFLPIPALPIRAEEVPADAEIQVRSQEVYNRLKPLYPSIEKA